MTLKVVDRFTTQHGSWDVNPAKPYGIDQAHRDKYEAGRLINGAGGDHHIFIKAPFDSEILFITNDGQNEFRTPGQHDWINFPIFADSIWNVYVDGELIAFDITLPGNEHVSTFLIVENIDEGSQPEQPTIPTGTVSHIQVLVDGVMIFDNWYPFRQG